MATDNVKTQHTFILRMNSNKLTEFNERQPRIYII